MHSESFSGCVCLSDEIVRRRERNLQSVRQRGKEPVRRGGKGEGWVGACMYSRM